MRPRMERPTRTATWGLPVQAMEADEGQILTYSLSGTDAGPFSITQDAPATTGTDEGGQIMVRAGTKLDRETKSTYMVTVTATDPGGLSASIDVTITVTDEDEAPEILVGGLSISGSAPAPYAENGTGPVATYRAVGSNAASATWSLSGDDAGDFRISRSGVLSFPRSPNYEAPTDADTDNVYQVTVRASDRRYNAMLAVTVRVTDVYEPPFVPSAPNVLQTVGEPTSLDVSWRAPSNGGGPDITSYDLQYRMSGSGNFIDGPQNVTGTSTTITGLTEDTSYEVQVRATNDEGDSGWSTAGMGSTGTSSNNAPIFPDPTLTRSIMENTEADTNVGAVILAATDADRGDTLTYTMEGTDAASFTFDASTRQIKTSADLDFETKSSYSVTIKVSDGTDSDTVVVTVTVTDVNEAPTISGLSNTDYAENGTDPVATFTAMDPEGTTISWTLEGTDSDALSISSDGVLTFRSPPDYETKTTYMITVEASDGTNMASHEVAIMVTDVDEVPTIEGDATIDYAENGTGDVATFTAMDPEGTAISWALSGIDAGVFDISAAGMLTFKESPDYEMPADADTDNTYMVTVEASDGPNMDSLDVTVTVTDVDEALTTISGPSNTDYAENGTDDVATFTAMDPEGTTISWTLEGTDADVFDISNGGVLTFKSSPDYEMPADADNNNTYMVTVEASAGADMDTLEVTVTVTDEDDTTVGEDLLNTYDTDGDNQISKDEAIAAINDYLFGVGDEQITKDQVLEVIALYLFG